MQIAPLNIIGVMTGNSLDGADLVLTQYSADGIQKDLITHSLSTPPALRENLVWFRQVINDERGDVAAVVAKYPANTTSNSFQIASDAYVEFVAQAVNQLVSKAMSKGFSVDLIGFHGQTCAHCPPSIAKSKDPNLLYTVQIGDGQKLADLTGITVIYDFRSDDLMNFGEAAPFAPIHHQHLAEQTRKVGQFPIAFCNAGNTGNITVISEPLINKTLSSGDIVVQGWDTGPFNNFPDKLMQLEKQADCDRDGLFGRAGKVQLGLLNKLFNQAVLTKEGENFLLKSPPRSSDPEWYKIIPELTDSTICFEDRIRTAEYFSAYIFFYTLKFISADLRMPAHFAVCGGGWKNPVSFDAFNGLISGDFIHNPVLAEHLDLFEKISKRIVSENKNKTNCAPSEYYGFDGTAMEARIFSDAAMCRLRGEAFSLPSTTGVSKPTVAGIIRFPQKDRTRASKGVLAYLDSKQSWDLTVDDPAKFDSRWSRASAGWHRRI